MMLAEGMLLTDRPAVEKPLATKFAEDVAVSVVPKLGWRDP